MEECDQSGSCGASRTKGKLVMLLISKIPHKTPMVMRTRREPGEKSPATYRQLQWRTKIAYTKMVSDHNWVIGLV